MNDRSVLDKADALMRRHRSFVARDPAAPPPPPVPDIPVLTEKVGADETADPQEQMQAVLEAELERWLAEALPAAVTEVSAILTAELAIRAREELLPNLLETLKNGTSQKL